MSEIDDQETEADEPEEPDIHPDKPEDDVGGDGESVVDEEQEESDEEESNNGVEGVIVTSIVILGGVIAGFISYTYFDSSSWMSMLPAFGLAFLTLAVLSVAGLPENRGKKHDAFVLVLTLAIWFISFTVFLQ